MLRYSICCGVRCAVQSSLRGLAVENTRRTRLKFIRTSEHFTEKADRIDTAHRTHTNRVYTYVEHTRLVHGARSFLFLSDFIITE